MFQNQNSTHYVSRRKMEIPIIFKRVTNSFGQRKPNSNRTLLIRFLFSKRNLITRNEMKYCYKSILVTNDNIAPNNM